MAAVERHTAMGHKNQTAGCLQCQNGTKRICRHAGGVNELAATPPWRPSSPGSHLCHQVTLTEMKVMKWKVWHPGVCIYILCFQRLNFWIPMHMPRIASEIKILFQICSVHYLLHGNTTEIVLMTMIAFCENVSVKMTMDWKEQDCWVLSLSTISGHFKV